MRRNEQDRQYWIDERVEVLIEKGHSVSSAHMIARREWSEPVDIDASDERLDKSWGKW